VCQLLIQVAPGKTQPLDIIINNRGANFLHVTLNNAFRKLQEVMFLQAVLQVGARDVEKVGCPGLYVI
jgi:hypothetical protein